MAAITPAYKKECKVGSSRMISAHFTTVTDGDTWASGINQLSSSPMFQASVIGTPSGATTCGVNISYSAGTVTFKMGTDAKPVDLLIII